MANFYINYWGKNLYKSFTNQIDMKNYNLMGNSPGSDASICLNHDHVSRVGPQWGSNFYIEIFWRNIFKIFVFQKTMWYEYTIIQLQRLYMFMSILREIWKPFYMSSFHFIYIVQTFVYDSMEAIYIKAIVAMESEVAHGPLFICFCFLLLLLVVIWFLYFLLLFWSFYGRGSFAILAHNTYRIYSVFRS